ncbi:MAG: HAD-IC family P-type ATPase [Candidatus Micrarchaeota archaeon]
MPESSASYHSISAEEALSSFKVGKDGLSKEEAELRLKQYGPNTLKARKKATLFEMFIGEFKDFVILLLIAAAIISAITTYMTNEGEYLDSIAIIAIVVINAIIGVFQQYRANQAIEALRRLVLPKANVVRNGKEMEINTSELVPGDIIILHEGDKVPADSRLIESHNLEADESSLTGESNPVGKSFKLKLDVKAVINDRQNMLFMSTLVTKGEARAVVCFTGGNTEIGKIATLVQSIGEEETPLQHKLDQLGKQLGKMAIAATVLVFAIGFIREIMGNGFEFHDVLQLFLVSVALAVAAIPEGLPAVVTIALAIGVQRMAKRNSIIRRLSAAEGLGSATVICSDKTGTLTRNEMTVRKIFTNGREYSVSGQGYSAEGEFSDEKGKKLLSPLKEANFSPLFHSAVLCNNASLTDTGILGDPTEACLLVVSKKAGMDYLLEKKSRKKVEELTFDSERKMMSVIYDEDEAGVIAYTKGAPEMLIEKCGFYLKDGKQVKLDAAMRQTIEGKNADFASEGLRVLGFAYRNLKTSGNREFKIGDVERELVFVGLMAMMDPPRKEVRDAIALCKQAGIRVVMITGDNELTAKVIAKELGMFDEKTDKVLTGRQLEDLPDSEYEKIASEVAVYARVSPEHKLRIVSTLQRKGESVAMTGDGVNDAPAIKKSDIGVAMGITGTDVAKESADMVITDDNFASIVAAVEEGRILFDNIMKAVKYLLSCNIGEVLVILLAIIIGWDYPLLPIQILWMNLATDALPALALAADTKAKDIMCRPPRKPDEPVIPKDDMVRLGMIGALITIGTLAMFWWGLNSGIPDHELALEKARTLAFSTIIFFQLFIALSWHAHKAPILEVGVFKNRFLVAAVLIGFVSQILIVQTGILEAIFYTVPLLPLEWAMIFLVGSSVFIVEEIIKYFYKPKAAAAEEDD